MICVLFFRYEVNFSRKDTKNREGAKTLRLLFNSWRLGVKPDGK